MRNTADMTGGKPIAVWSQSFSAMEERERCYSFILSRAPHETPTIDDKTINTK
jgi:hypothetical protein